MEVISIIVMFLFGNMNDTEDKMTQYIPMENLSSCLKEKRILARNKEFFGVVITPLDTHLMSAIIGLYFGGSLVKK